MSNIESQPIFVVQLDVTPEKEEAWNDWYNTIHVPEVMSCSAGIISATRYRLTSGTMEHKYMAIYMFRSRAFLDEFLASESLARMGREYDDEWGAFSTRNKGAYEPIFHKLAE